MLPTQSLRKGLPKRALVEPYREIGADDDQDKYNNKTWKYWYRQEARYSLPGGLRDSEVCILNEMMRHECRCYFTGIISGYS